MITKAFILGAGLGTRLRPLTDVMPKPLVPIYHEPMVNYALRHCQAAGITDFAINTHYLPDAWSAAYPDGTFNGSRLQFFYEPVLLETGGGTVVLTNDGDSDIIIGYYGRAGIEIAAGRSAQWGIGVRYLGGELDFNDTVGEFDLEGLQILFTYSAWY